MYPVPLKGLLPPNQNMSGVVDNLGTYAMYMAGYVKRHCMELSESKWPAERILILKMGFIEPTKIAVYVVMVPVVFLFRLEAFS